MTLPKYEVVVVYQDLLDLVVSKASTHITSYRVCCLCWCQVCGDVASDLV